MSKKINYTQVVDNTWANQRQRSSWHYDYDRKDPDFKTIMQIRGTWTECMNDFERWMPAGYNFHGDLNGFKGKKSLEYMSEKARAGWSDQTQYYHTTQTFPPVIERMRDLITNYLEIEEPYARCHKQLPGHQVPVHVDTFESYPGREKYPYLDLSQVIRVAVALSDWDLGHIWQIGNTPWIQWKAGDVIYSDMINLPHWTANCGGTPRYTMLVMGIAGPNTMDIIRNNDVQNITLDF